jgi:3-methyladenine DNA glycosylase/8-oxoguanine DNA glycosylase
MVDPYVYIKEIKEWWTVPERSCFHHCCSLVTSQQITFNKGRQIRQALYKLSKNHGYKGHLTPKFIKELTPEQLQATGLTSERCQTLKDLADIGETKNIDDYAKVVGVGVWTIKGTKLSCGTDDHIVLYEDKWIRQRIGQLVGKATVTEAEAKEIFKTTWPQHESLMSYFLWRCKQSGIDKLMRSRALSRSDFV